MGTNLELHSEVKISGKWHHYGCPNLPRDYRLFGKMAGIRNDPEWGIKPLAFTTGMPEDATELTEIAWKNQPLVKNEVRVLGIAEIKKLTEWYETIHEPGRYMEEVFDYLFHDAWSEQEGVEDVRFIFWET